MEVRSGYKQTEAGVIPEDWVLEPIAAVATTVASGRSSVDAEFGDFPVYGSTGMIGRSVKGDYAGRAILVARVGANAGKLNVVDGKYGVTDNNTIIVRISDSVLWSYVWRQLDAKRLNSMVFGSGQPLITGTQIKNLLIPFPSTRAEQEAIAQALSDADALIESLEQLLAKKRQLKQGAMQELLTGKKRLPGFKQRPGYKQTEVGLIPEDWGLDFIENLAHITTGSRNTQDRVDDGQYPFFVRSQAVERINSYSFDGEAVLTAGDGVGTGKVFHYIKGKFDAHQRVYRISNFSEEISGYFFYLYFSSHFYGRIMQMTAKSSVDSVRREMIVRMLIPLPPTKAEQETIATILSDMDAEIAALESKLAKARRLKQGMMQELLTGRIRLV